MAVRLGPLSLLLVAVLAAGCGSTVQVTSSRQQGTTDDSLSVPGSDGLGGTATGVGLPQGTAGPQVPGAATAGTTPATGSSRVLGQTGSTATLSGPGVTAKEIYVGFVHDGNADGVNSAAGVGSITHGDDQANALAVVDDINKHGGIAGRKVVPVFARFDSTSTQTLDQQWAAVCQTFTHDKRVFAYAAGTSGRPSLRDCLARAGVAMLSSGLPTVGASDFAQHPAYIEMGYPNVDRLAAYTVTPLVEQKYFTPWDTVNGKPAAAGVVKVGVLTYDDSTFSHAVDQYLVPALRRLGYDPVVQKIAQISGASDIGAQAAAVKAAQLAFASNGVTHVIPFEANGGLSTFFLPTARTQGYYPRYGVSSASGSEALMESGVVDAQQFNGAVGFGWIPAIDLASADNRPDGPYSNANRRACLKVMHDHGITFDSGNAEAIGLTTCATLYLLKAALDRTPRQVTVATLLRSVEGLGASYQPAGSVGIRFRPGRHDPAETAYHWRFVSSCTCFRYDGEPHTVP